MLASDSTQFDALPVYVFSAIPGSALYIHPGTSLVWTPHQFEYLSHPKHHSHDENACPAIHPILPRRKACTKKQTRFETLPAGRPSFGIHSSAMNSLVAFLRFLRRNITLTIVNLTGLSLGISSCIFISIFIIDELSYDSSNIKAERIYRLSSELISQASVDHVPLTPMPLAESLKKDFTGVEHAIRIQRDDEEVNVKIGDRPLLQRNVFKADPEIFEVFTYPIISGDARNPLAGPNKTVLTISTAHKFFGEQDPIGKIVTVDKRDHIVTAVMEDIPLNSDLTFTMLISMDSTDNKTDWFNFDYTTYVLFDQKAISQEGYLADFQQRLDKLAEEKLNSVIRKEAGDFTVNLHMQRVKGIHFTRPLLYDLPKGNIYYTFIFAAIAFLILLIGCLNFINFSIVQSIERSRDVGIRKVVGASFTQLVRKYIGESLLFTTLALLVALVLVVVLMPVFNDLIGRKFSLAAIFDYRIMASMVLIVFLVGVLAGSYPAFYTSSMSPVMALKEKISTPGGQIIRKLSIGLQFFISIGLIICTFVVRNQMNFIKNFDLGFNKENLIVINASGDSATQSQIHGLVAGLKQDPKVLSVVVSGYGGVPNGDETSGQRGTWTFRSNGKDEVRMINASFIDENYIPTLKLRLVQGRNYDGSLSDFTNSILVNEALVKLMGWSNPLEQQVKAGGTYRNVIGVIADYHYMSLYNQVEPQVFPYHNNTIASVMVRLSGNSFRDDVNKLERLFHTYYPDEPFVYRFLDDRIREHYVREDKAMTIFSYFSILTISISCLGLFGLSSLTVFQRKKEIGIRRIIGADLESIIYLFSKEYIFLLVIATALVAPLVWYGAGHWLDTFPYRQTLSVLVYVACGVGAIVAALSTVLFSLGRIFRILPVSLIREN